MKRLGYFLGMISLMAWLIAASAQAEGKAAYVGSDGEALTCSSSATVAGENIILTNDGIFKCDVQSDGGTLMTPALEGIAAESDCLMADDRMVWGLNLAEGKLVGADAAASCVTLEGFPGELLLENIKSAVMTESKMFLLTEQQADYNKSDLYCWDVAGGTLDFHLAAGDVQQIIPYVQDDLLAISRDEAEPNAPSMIGVFSTLNQTFETPHGMGYGSVLGVYYSRINDQICFIGDGKAYQGALFGAYTPFAYAGSIRHTYLDRGCLEGDTYSYWGKECVYHEQITNSLAETADIAVEGWAPLLQSLEVPAGITLSISNHNKDTEEISIELTTGSDDFDLYVVNYNGETARTLTGLFQKGYAAPVDMADVGAAFVEGLPTSIASLVCKDGRIVAVPIGVSCSSPMYEVDESVMDDIGLTWDQVPKDLLSLYQLVIRWSELADAKEDGIYPISLTAELTSAAYAAKAYAEQCSAGGQPLSFTSPAFRSLLECQQQAKAAAEAQGLGIPSGNAARENYLYNGRFLIADVPGYSLDFPALQRNPHMFRFAALPNEEGVYPLNVRFLLVNPHSKLLLQAEEVVAAYMSQLSDTTRGMLNPSALVPQTNPHYAEEQQALEDMLKANRDKLASADGADIRALQEEIAYLEQKMSRAEDNQYTISPEAIATYQQQMQSSFLPTFSCDAIAQFQSICGQLDAGSISLDACTQQLDRVFSMMEQE